MSGKQTKCDREVRDRRDERDERDERDKRDRRDLLAQADKQTSRRGSELHLGSVFVFVVLSLSSFSSLAFPITSNQH